VRECRVISAGPVVTTLVCYLHHSHARLWVQRAPGIPHALFGRKTNAQLGRSRRGNAETRLQTSLFEDLNLRTREIALPLPLAGEVDARSAAGGGMDYPLEERVLRRHPHPNPPPQAGEGEVTDHRSSLFENRIEFAGGVLKPSAVTPGLFLARVARMERSEIRGHRDPGLRCARARTSYWAEQ